MATLARKLRLPDYFAPAFGTMICTGWLILLDAWLGSGRSGKNRGVQSAVAEFAAALQRGGTAGLFAAADPGNRAHAFFSHAELPRHSRQRKFPEDHDLHIAADIRSPCRYQRHPGRAGEFSSGVSRDPLRLDFADAADCAVLLDGLRVRPQICGRSQAGVPRKELHEGYRPGLGGRRIFLRRLDRGGGLHRAVAELAGTEFRDGHRVRTRGWSQVAGGVDSFHGVFWAAA